MSIAEIDTLAQRLADARRQLAAVVNLAQAHIDEVKATHLPLIQDMTASVASAYDALYAAVEAEPAAFARPKTQVLHGIKVGYQKAKGKIGWADAGQVVRLIRKHLPEQADLLIKTAETPVKQALNGLSAADLKRIGVTVTEAGDRVVVIPVDSDLDKLVAALLGDPAADHAEADDREG